MVASRQAELPHALSERVTRFVTQTGLELTPSAQRVIGLSDFAARVARMQPEWFSEAMMTGAMDAAPADFGLQAEIRDLLDGVEKMDELKPVLRQLRNRRQLWVIWRHLLNQATFEETTGSLTSMADILIGSTLSTGGKWETARHGIPTAEATGQHQRLIVFGLGKLGGRELNLSSDV